MTRTLQKHFNSVTFFVKILLKEIKNFRDILHARILLVFNYCMSYLFSNYANSIDDSLLYIKTENTNRHFD